MDYSFGGQLRTKRQIRCLTLSQLARQLGITAAYLSDIERGNRNPGDAVAAKIAAEFDLHFDRTPEIARLRVIVEAARAYGVAYRAHADAGEYLAKAPYTSAELDAGNARYLQTMDEHTLAHKALIEALAAEQKTGPCIA